MPHDYDSFGDEDQRTVVDTSLWSQPKVPDYPTLARFGRFEILGRIARGGMAEVYLARERDEEDDVRHLVVKRVLPEMNDNEDLLRMFLSEGETAVRLYHPNVCHVYECGEVDGQTFMALEWVWGPSLDEVIQACRQKERSIPWPVVVEIVAQVAAALEYVHHAKGVGGKPLNIVHRDVSPHNVMLTWTGAVKLLDFGIAKTSSDKTTTGGGFVGKYAYMSPEQAQTQPVDPRSDIFALGIVLYEALTNNALYDRPTLLEVLHAVVHGPIPSILESHPSIPPELQPIIDRALQKNRDDRYQSAGELRDALKQVLANHQQIANEQRVKIFLSTIFEPARRTPLKRGSDRLTGAFSTLTAEGAAAIARHDEVVSLQSFDHSDVHPNAPAPSPGPSPSLQMSALPVQQPPPPAPAPAPEEEPEGSSWLFWIGILLLGVVMTLGGAAAAMFLLG